MERILPKIWAIATRHDRQKVVPGIDFEWSDSSWVHNLFRIYELVFWRRSGIRCEQISDSDGNVYSYTWENLLATYEGMARAWVKRQLPAFSIVYVPQVQLAGLSQGGITPFMFAIAFDNATPDGFAATSVLTFAHAVTGANTLILVGTTSGVASDTVTGITYSAVALSNGTSVVVPADRGTCLKYLKGAATGSNNVVVSVSVAGVAAIAFSYTGALQTGGIDASTTNTGTLVSTLTTTITTVANNCWTFMYAATDGNTTLTAGTGSTQRATTNTYYAYDSNGPVASGSNSMTVTPSGSSRLATNMMSFAPVAAPTVNSDFFMFM